MKAFLLTLIGCATVFGCSLALAWSNYTSYGCNGGNCSASPCNPYETNCQCTDPSCNRPWDNDCMSRKECCEAFGNMGAR